MLAVEAEMAKTRRALERYFSAFEDGTLSSKRLADRVEGLEQRMNELHGRKDELRETIEGQDYAAPTDADLGDIVAAIREAFEQGTPAQRKALMRTLVAGVTVQSREAIQPIFRLPAEQPVRLMSPMVGGAGFEPATSCV